MAERQQALAQNSISKILQLKIYLHLLALMEPISHLNSGRMLITLKPIEQRDASASASDSASATKISTKFQVLHLYMQPVQDFTIDDRVSRTQYQYSVGSPDAAEVTKWTDLLLQKLKQSPELRDVASDQQNLGLQTSINY